MLCVIFSGLNFPVTDVSLSKSKNLKIILAKKQIVCYNSFCCTARGTNGKLAQLGEHSLDV